MILASPNDFFQETHFFIGVFGLLLGAVVGSFINVISLRLPKMMERSWHTQCHTLLGIQREIAEEETVFNLAFPPSHCPHCQHAIRWWENIPVISFLILRGKCSACKQAISIQYPLVEIITAVSTATVFWQMGLSLQTYAALLLTWCLITLATIDAKTHLLPDDITLPLLWCGLAVNIFSIFASLQEAVIGAMLGYITLWAIFWAYKLFTQKEGMGYGDFKLLAALGAWMGWQALPIIILISSLVGAITGLALIFIKNRDSQVPIPFGPYLATAGWVTLLWGSHISAWLVVF